MSQAHVELDQPPPLPEGALRAKGLPAGPVRSPLVDAGDDELNQLRQDAAAAGIVL